MASKKSKASAPDLGANDPKKIIAEVMRASGDYDETAVEPETFRELTPSDASTTNTLAGQEPLFADIGNQLSDSQRNQAFEVTIEKANAENRISNGIADLFEAAASKTRSEGKLVDQQVREHELRNDATEYVAVNPGLKRIIGRAAPYVFSVGLFVAFVRGLFILVFGEFTVAVVSTTVIAGLASFLSILNSAEIFTFTWLKKLFQKGN